MVLLGGGGEECWVAPVAALTWTCIFSCCSYRHRGWHEGAPAKRSTTQARAICRFWPWWLLKSSQDGYLSSLLDKHTSIPMEGGVVSRTVLGERSH